MADVSDPSQLLEAVIVGGPNGSGKTTFIQSFLRDRVYPYLSADLIAAKLSPNLPSNAAIAAGREFLRQLEQTIVAKQSFVLESTLSGKSLKHSMVQLQQSGYRISMNFVFLCDGRHCVERVKARVRSGGHHVPAEDVVRRFARSKQNFWTIYREFADDWRIFYNSGTCFELVAEGEFDAVHIQDQVLFGLFNEGVTS